MSDPGTARVYDLRMRWRKRLIVIGDGRDVLVARGIISPGTSDEPGRGTVSIMLRLDEDACRRGVRTLQLLGEAIRARRIGEIARLRVYFPEIVERVPMLHAFLDRLHRARRSRDIARILGERRRGRKIELPHLAAAVAAAVDREGLSPKDAAAAVFNRYRRELGNINSARTFLNSYSGRQRELLELYRGPQAVPGAVLTRSRWKPSEQEDHDGTSKHQHARRSPMSKGQGGRGNGAHAGGTKGSGGGKGGATTPNLPSTTGQPSGGGRGNAPAR